MLFKFGVAHDLHARWSNTEFGYARLGCYKMVALCHVPSNTARALEKALIGRYSAHISNRNVASGGEGIPRSSYDLYFVYVVFGGRLGDALTTTYGPIRHH